MNSVKDPAQETQLDNPIRSPFQLNKTKGPVKLVPLHAAIRESGHGTALSQSTSATSSSSSIETVGSGDTMSPKSALGENPFSFSVKKIESVNLSARSNIAGNFNCDNQKIIEQQKEISRLKKDIEAKNKDIESKEAKLSSSVKSIKQFWSPELKKERALRKEEEERAKHLEEKCHVWTSQLQECQDTVQQLETKLYTKEDEIKSLYVENKEQNREITNLQIELEKLKEECENVVELNEKLTNLENTNRKIIDENRKKSSTIRELETLVNDNGKLAEDYIDTENKLQFEYEAHDKTKQLLEKCEEEIQKLKEENAAVEGKKDVACLEDELSCVKESLTQQKHLYEKARDDVKNFQKKEQELIEQVSEFKDQFSAKHEDCERLEQGIALLNAEKKRAEVDLNAVSKAQERSEHKYKDLNSSHQKLIKQYDELIDIHESNEATKLDLEKEIERLTQRINEFDSEGKKLVGENTRLEGEIGNILASQEESKRALETTEKRLSKQIEEKECELVEVWEEKEKYVIENQILVDQKRNLEEEMKEVKERLTTQINENSKLRKSEEKLKQQYLTVQDSVKELEEKNRISDSKESKLVEAWAENKKYEIENEILINQKDKLEVEIQEVKEKLTTQKNENLKLKNGEEKLQKDYLSTQETVKELEEKVRITVSESQQMSEKLNHNERHIADLEIQLQKSKSAGMSSMILTEDLKLKTNEVQELTLKYNNLNKYLSERETALDNSRDEVAELKGKNQTFFASNTKLETEIRALKVQMDKLEKEKLNLEKEKEDSVPSHAYQQLKSEFDTLKDKHDKQKNLLDTKEQLVKDLEINLQEKEKETKENEEKLQELQRSDCSSSVDQSEMEKTKAENEELAKEINFLKMKVSTLEKQKVGSVVDEKPLVAKKNLWDDLSKKDARIEELEKLLKEKSRQLTAMKKSKNTEWEKQQIKMSETKKSEDDLEGQLAKFKTDNEQKANRISLLEEALREMVAVAKERENIMARYAEVYEEVEGKYEEADREYSRICFERSITNIKNALLILILCQREALISSMKSSYKGYLDELFALRQERLMTSISEMDTQIAHLESQSPKNKREEIKQMRQEKEKYVIQLKEHNNHSLRLNSNEDKIHGITCELKEAPSEQVLEAIRHLSHTNTLLESKVEEFLTFLRDKNAELLKDITDVPVRRVRPIEQLQSSPKDELMKELVAIEEHSAKLQKFVEDLLTLLEGEQ